MAARAAQSNAMKYSLITFVALFLIAATAAVIFYLKSEEYRTLSQTKTEEAERFVNRSEQSNLAKIVGNADSGKSILGTMNERFNQLFTFIAGQPQTEMPATVKANQISMAIDSLNKLLGEDNNPAYGTQGISLLQTIQGLKTTLDETRQQLAAMQSQYQTLQEDFDAAKQNALFTEQALRDEASKYQALRDEVQAKYDELKTMMDTSTEEQIQSYKDRIEQEQAKLKQKQLELETLQAKLDETEKSLDGALAKLEGIQKTPDTTASAYKRDARIIRVDLQNGIVYLNIGAEDHVYRGLTFAVYDSSAPIPEDGQGKAEIEVFQVNPNVSAARMTRSSIRNPIVQEDIVANLVWDPDSSNKFIIAGDFDLNQDGRIESDGQERIKEMILRWGGIVQDEVSVDTDFVIIGHTPTALPAPRQEDVDLDPTARQRYDQANLRADAYNQVLEKARRLSVPIFNQKQFYYLLGYETLANK